MRKFTAFVISIVICGCASGPVPGPDKQGAGTVEGAAMGAGAGAVTGAQLSFSTGAGMLVGAGLGAVAGGIQGAVQDGLDDASVKNEAQLRQERERAVAQEMLADHFQRRMALYPIS